MSDRSKKELKSWMQAKAQRIEKLIEKFEYLPCEFCLYPIYDVKNADAHHNNHDRRNCSFANMRICHPYCNRISIEDNNVRDVPSLL